MGDKKFFFFAFTLLINVTGFNALEGEAIVGGHDVQEHKFLYTVSIRDVMSNTDICSGGIIGTYHVVTAAHCVASQNGLPIGKPLLVIGGTTDLNSFSPEKREVYVEKVFIPVRFYTDVLELSGDIAVLKLKNAIDFGPNSRLELPAMSKNHDGLMANFTGFGWNDVRAVRNRQTGEYDESGISYGKMRFAEVEILTQNMYQNYRLPALPWVLMVGRVVQRNDVIGEGTCNGDSGGPLVYNGKILVGVLNRSPPGCDEWDFPSQYARVSSYVQFIDHAVNDRQDPMLKSFVLPSRY